LGAALAAIVDGRDQREHARYDRLASSQPRRITPAASLKGWRALRSRHLHRLNVHTNATFAGPRYSVDGGSLADPKSEGFDYAEGAAEQVQGFVVLTYVGGELLMPELAFMHKELVYFRGQPV
jgi:hypothetical protein